MLYHIITINERSGRVTRCTAYPMPHAEACAMLRKFSYHPARRVQMQPA